MLSLLSGANQLIGEKSGCYDGHVHVFRTNLVMDPDRRYTPSSDARFEALATLLADNGLNGALLVQPSFLGTDNSFLLESLRQGGKRSGMLFRGVAVVAPSITIAELTTLAVSGVVGVRFNLVGREDSSAFDVKPWRSVFRFAADHNWHIELHSEGYKIPSLLKSFLPLTDKLVIDHFGLPDSAAPGKCSGHQALMSASKGKLFIKASAPYRVFPAMLASEAVANCGSLFSAFLDKFGPEQMLWGSDWPWTQHEGGHTYKDTVQWQRDWLASTSDGSATEPTE